MSDLKKGKTVEEVEAEGELELELELVVLTKPIAKNEINRGDNQKEFCHTERPSVAAWAAIAGFFHHKKTATKGGFTKTQ